MQTANIETIIGSAHCDRENQYTAHTQPIGSCQSAVSPIHKTQDTIIKPYQTAAIEIDASLGNIQWLWVHLPPFPCPWSMVPLPARCLEQVLRWFPRRHEAYKNVQCRWVAGRCFRARRPLALEDTCLGHVVPQAATRSDGTGA